MVASVVATFVVLVALSTPIVFALGLSGMLGLVLGNFSLQKLPSALVAGSQSWVLLAVPTFVFNNEYAIVGAETYPTFQRMMEKFGYPPPPGVEIPPDTFQITFNEPKTGED